MEKNVFNQLEDLLIKKSAYNERIQVFNRICELIEYCDNETLVRFLTRKDFNRKYHNGYLLTKEDYNELFKKFELNKNKSFIRTLVNEYNYEMNCTATNYEITNTIEYICKIIDHSLEGC